MREKPAVIIGAGPAGLAAGYEFVCRGRFPVILERASTVGGISRTESYRDFLFDIGGHRFFTRNEEIRQLWENMLGTDFLTVDRLSRIYYRGKLFNYPLRPVNALRNLGPLESLRVVISYCRAGLFPKPREDNFEEWVVNRFGERLYKTFFKTYTEKVWGIPCHEIGADWAAQRIKGLSLLVAVSNALFGGQQAKSLIEQFSYPRLGPGMMWQRFRERIEAAGGEVRLQSEVSALHHSDSSIKTVEYTTAAGVQSLSGDSYISSMPLPGLVRLFKPRAPADVLAAAGRLAFRSFIIVVLVIDREELFPDQWLYIHSPKVKVGRVQNFKNWSRFMVPDPGRTSIGLEYFCNEHDATWELSDDALVELATREMEEMGFGPASLVSDSHVVRESHAYPVYDAGYQENLETVRRYLDRFVNLQTVGRNGMHRYNNMDHAMQTGILAARNFSGETHDIWAVNEEKSYLEEARAAEDTAAIPEKILERAFARMDKFAFAVALGAVCGLLVFSATLWIISRGGDVLNSHLRLLAQYFIGYTVTVRGGFIAFAYTFFWGFLFGWLFAYLRNLFLAIYLYRIKRKVEMLSLKDFFDNY